jgi:GNAT superfamily N-acetyltransferase
VACDDELGVVGFYTLNVCSVIPSTLPEETLRRLPKYSEIPGVFIGRLASDLRMRGRGIGESLMIDVFRRAQRINEEAAVSLVVLDSKDDNATQFYKRFGFTPLVTDSRRLFVPLATVLKAYAASLKAV